MQLTQNQRLARGGGLVVVLVGAVMMFTPVTIGGASAHRSCGSAVVALSKDYYDVRTNFKDLSQTLVRDLAIEELCHDAASGRVLFGVAVVAAGVVVAVAGGGFRSASKVQGSTQVPPPHASTGGPPPPPGA